MKRLGIALMAVALVAGGAPARGGDLFRCGYLWDPARDVTRAPVRLAEDPEGAGDAVDLTRLVVTAHPGALSFAFRVRDLRAPRATGADDRVYTVDVLARGYRYLVRVSEGSGWAATADRYREADGGPSVATRVESHTATDRRRDTVFVSVLDPRWNERAPVRIEVGVRAREVSQLAPVDPLPVLGLDPSVVEHASDRMPGGDDMRAPLRVDRPCRYWF